MLGESLSTEPDSFFIIPNESVVGEHAEISWPSQEFDALMFRERDEFSRSLAGCHGVSREHVPPGAFRL